MKRIALTQGKVALVDNCDYELLTRHKWHASFMNGSWYAHRSFAGGGGICMHVQIMGKRKSHRVDHADRNGLNNQRCNLRWATRSQNRANGPGFSKFGVKGVFQNGRGFGAQITVSGKRIYLGHFSSVGAAARAYNRAAKQHFGEFACLNRI